jgi:hypothetical protein
VKMQYGSKRQKIACPLLWAQCQQPHFTLMGVGLTWELGKFANSVMWEKQPHAVGTDVLKPPESPWGCEATDP